MSQKNASGADSLAKLGFKDEEKLQKFLAHPSNKFIQKKFDQIFPPVDKPKFASTEDLKRTGATSTGLKSAVVTSDDGPDELDLGADLELGNEDVAMSEDKDLELGDVGELSLGDDTPVESAPADEGLDLSLDGGLELGGDEDLSAAPDEAEDVSELTSLKIGADVNLDDDVMAKLAEIDEIMEADATNAALKRPAELDEKAESTNPGMELGGLDLSEDGDDDLLASPSLGDDEPAVAADEGAGLDLGGEDLGLGDDDLLAAPSLGDDEDDSLSASSLTDPGTLDGPELGALEDDAGDDLFAQPLSAAQTSPSLSAAPKKPLPKAPALEEESEEEGLEFGMEAVEEEPVMAAPKKADRTAELPVPPGFGKKKSPEIERMNDGHVEMDAPRAVSSSEERSSYKEVVGNYNHELERIQATMNHLRADRNDLLKKIETLEEDKLIHNRHVLGMRAELDEKKIEVQLLKKRMTEETQDLKYQFELEQERRKLAEERARAYQMEAQTLQQKVKMEVKKVSSREKELEQKLELLKADAETQIRHRDLKILELKRRIDALEFDMDAMNTLEQKSVGDKQELEGKLDKAIKTLRTAIGILESDDPKLATLEKLKKNLEV